MELHEIAEQTALLNNDGTLKSPGWSRHTYWKHSARKAGFRVGEKAWDCYSITDEAGHFSIRVLFAELGYTGFFSIAFIDYALGQIAEVHGTKVLSRNTRMLADDPTADSAVTYADSNMTIALVRKGAKHQILITAPYLVLPSGSIGLKADIVLHEKQDAESLNTARPIDDTGRYWRHSRKLQAMEAKGILFINHITYHLTAGRSYGTMDWVRGYWPIREGWFAASASGCTDKGEMWRINLEGQYSEKDSSPVFSILFEDRLHKLDAASFSHSDDCSGNWRILCRNGDADISIETESMLVSELGIKGTRTSKRLIPGLFSGFFVLDDGRRIDISDAYGCIVEARSRW